MKMILAALSAVLALTALPGQAAAGTRSGPAEADRGGLVLVQDGYRRGGYRDDRGEDGFGEVMPERRIVRRLIRQGFVSIEDIRLRRDRYIVEAVRPNGALVRLVLDAFDGEIIDRERIGWVRDGGRRGPREGWRGERRGGPAIEFDLGGGAIELYSR